MLSRAVIITLALATFYHLSSLVLPSHAALAQIPQQSTLSDSTRYDVLNNAAQYVGHESKLNIINTPPAYTKPYGLLADSSEPPTPTTQSADGNKNASLGTIDSTSFESNATFHSYGPQKCLSSFNDTLQQRASTLHASCASSAPFFIKETYRVGFATASSGSALSSAYELAMQSQMTHATIHNTSVHMLCADIVPGNWNKIAYLIHLITLELLKPESERLDWMLWLDRDSLILDQCRPLSSFLPPNTAEYNNIDLIAAHDVNGLNAGVFLFRPSTWALEFFNTVAAYRHFNPKDDLAFAEQTAMARLLDTSPQPHVGIDGQPYSKHFARVPWYWFNAYPPEDGDTAPYTSNVYAESYAWFRPHKGDFLAHFAGHPAREGEMVRWGKMLAEEGVVWQSEGDMRDVSADVRHYWNAWKSGVVTDGMRSGEPGGRETED